MKTPFYITTTLPYVNAPLHMGHALEFIRADTIARYKTLLGFDVFFNTGTDEHGQKIHNTATALGKTPQAFVDEGFSIVKEQIKSFGVTDAVHYVRTTDEQHCAAAQEFWNRVQSNGYIYKKNYEAKYCVGCESEKTDSELVEGKCIDHPYLEIEIINEENYFFQFSAFQEKLLAFYEQNPNFIVPALRFNEMKSFVEGGLHDFSISRIKEKMSWGVPVPGDDAQVMYVWFDALVNYISTLGWPNDDVSFEKYWMNGTPTQYCGKDNTRFQGVMWQAMLMAADIPNSHKIVVNGHITGAGGVKMSKSLGNVVDPLVISYKFSPDVLRFFLLREVTSFEDSPFTNERFLESYQANLANGLGNLVSRIMKMVVSYEVDYVLPAEDD
ncbi:methionine--tRNA ligase, partial [Patescibacteria group bacterium]|nr:methionine--tRNA ligase [Patescibacteria group bacterium]